MQGGAAWGRMSGGGAMAAAGARCEAACGVTPAGGRRTEEDRSSRMARRRAMSASVRSARSQKCASIGPAAPRKTRCRKVSLLAAHALFPGAERRVHVGLALAVDAEHALVHKAGQEGVDRLEMPAGLACAERGVDFGGSGRGAVPKRFKNLPLGVGNAGRHGSSEFLRL